MAHWTYLLQLLATFQMLVSSAQNDLKINVTLNNCPQKWTIRDTSAYSVLKIRCWNKKNKIELKVHKLPGSCAGVDDSTCTCLKTTINNLDLILEIVKGSQNLNLPQEFTLCKKPHKCSCPSKTICNDCKENLQLIVRTPGPSAALEVVHKQIVSDGADNDTGNSLTFHNESRSWIQALQHCSKLNSTLVQITNLTVEEEVMSLLEGKTELQNGVWIGLERSIFGTDIEWKWISGISDKYLERNSSFPVDPLNHHCGKIIWLEESQDIQLLDGNCHEKLPFICQGVK